MPGGISWCSMKNVTVHFRVRFHGTNGFFWETQRRHMNLWTDVQFASFLLHHLSCLYRLGCYKDWIWFNYMQVLFRFIANMTLFSPLCFMLIPTKHLLSCENGPAEDVAEPVGSNLKLQIWGAKYARILFFGIHLHSLPLQMSPWQILIYFIYSVLSSVCKCVFNCYFFSFESRFSPPLLQWHNFIILCNWKTVSECSCTSLYIFYVWMIVLMPIHLNSILHITSTLIWAIKCAVCLCIFLIVWLPSPGLPIDPWTSSLLLYNDNTDFCCWTKKKTFPKDDQPSTTTATDGNVLLPIFTHLLSSIKLL